MKWTAIIVSAVLLGGCASRSIPNLEDVPPTPQASTAPGASTPNLEDVPPMAKASTAPGASTPNLEDVPATAQSGKSVEPSAKHDSANASSAPTEAANSDRKVKLTAQQRSDIEQGVRRGLPGSRPAQFGPMAATVSRVTTKSYIVCGWVEGGDSAAGFRPFLAMYVPYMRTALLVAVGGKQPEELVRQRCVAEGVPLPS
jgi:hypothetical protein